MEFGPPKHPNTSRTSANRTRPYGGRHQMSCPRQGVGLSLNGDSVLRSDFNPSEFLLHHLIQLKKPFIPPLPSHPSLRMSDSSGTSSGYHLSLNETYDLIFVLYTNLYVTYTPKKIVGFPLCQHLSCLLDRSSGDRRGELTPR